MTSNEFKAFLFDLDGTLHFSQPSGFQAFLEYGRGLGLEFTPEAERLTERWQHQFWADRDTLTQLFAEMDSTAAWLEISRRQLAMLGVADPQDEYVRAIQDRFTAEYKPVSHIPQEVHDTLTALRTKGYVIGLVSNRDGPLGPAAEEYGITGLFDFTLSAGEAGSWKPHPVIFERALALAGVPAEAAGYVGDNYYADVLGAQGAGLVPFLYDPTGLFPEAACRILRSLTELLEL